MITQPVMLLLQVLQLLTRLELAYDSEQQTA